MTKISNLLKWYHPTVSSKSTVWESSEVQKVSAFLDNCFDLTKPRHPRSYWVPSIHSTLSPLRASHCTEVWMVVLFTTVVVVVVVVVVGVVVVVDVVIIDVSLFGDWLEVWFDLIEMQIIMINMIDTNADINPIFFVPIDASIL